LCTGKRSTISTPSKTSKDSHRSSDGHSHCRHPIRTSCYRRWSMLHPSSDYFTKWACAFALPDAEASTCMRMMYDGFFAQFGLPNQLHTDQGRNFESKLFHKMCQLTGVVTTRTMPFHPQSDGQTERMNHTLLQMLRCTADEHPENWPHRLPTVMAAYRMTVHKVTGVIPNMAMLGREVLLPASLIARPPI